VNDQSATAGQQQQPGLLKQAWDKAVQFVEADRKKLGGMTFGAMARLGLAEIREASSMGGNVAQPTPYGMYGTLTPGEVGAARHDDPNVAQMEEALPTPSQIADGKSSRTVSGDQQQKQNVTSPSDIAEGKDQQQGRQQGQNHTQKQNRGRGM
jgi:hypothetical protein